MFRDMTLLKSRGLFLLLVFFACCSNIAHADYYVNFADGHLLVFPSSSISEMQDSADVVEFTAVDGTVYSYAKSDVASIDTQLTKELPTITSYKFNNKYNYQVVTDAVGTIDLNHISVEVIGIGKWLTASFNLSDENACAYVDGKKQTTKESRLHFDTAVTYTVGYPGDMILSQVGEAQYAFVPFGQEYVVDVDFLTDHSTTVPRIDINTVGGVDILSRSVYVDAEIIIDGAGVFPSMTDSVQIKGRGNTSWTHDANAKNPYRLKFAEKVKPLGLTKGKSWVLLANNMEASMLSNAYGMKASSLIGTVAANHMIPVDLYINGKYRGSYNFTEKVGFSNNSIDLDDESAAALLELDRYFDEAIGQKFFSTPLDIPVNIKEPEFAEGTTVLTFLGLKSRFNSFVKGVENGKDLANYVDIDNLARYLLATDLICNKEIFHPKSTFCYYENALEGSSKLVFGPMWDLDWACGYYYDPVNTYFENLVDYDFFNSNYNGAQYEFMRKLGVNRKVSRRMYELAKEFKENGLDELCDFCAEYYQYAEPSLIYSMNAYPDSTDYAAQSQKASVWFRERFNNILNRLVGENVLIGDVNDDGELMVDDLVALIDYLLDEEVEIIEENTDVNGDGVIDIDDLSALIDMLLST